MIKDLLKNKSSDPLQELLQRKFFENNINIELELGQESSPEESHLEEDCHCGKPDCPICIEEDPDPERRLGKEQSIKKGEYDEKKGIAESSAVYSNGYSDNKSL